jgi:hypothetical protein
LATDADALIAGTEEFGFSIAVFRRKFDEKEELRRHTVKRTRAGSIISVTFDAVP